MVSPFGELILKSRERAGISQAALSRALGCSHVWLGAIERGQHKALAPKFWKVLEQATGTPVEEWRRAHLRSVPITINVMGLPQGSQEIAVKFAQFIQGQGVTDTDLRNIEAALCGAQ